MDNAELGMSNERTEAMCKICTLQFCEDINRSKSC